MCKKVSISFFIWLKAHKHIVNGHFRCVMEMEINIFSHTNGTPFRLSALIVCRKHLYV